MTVPSRWARSVGEGDGSEIDDPWAEADALLVPALCPATRALWRAALDEARAAGIEPVIAAFATVAAGYPATLCLRWRWDRWLRVSVEDAHYLEVPYYTIFSSAVPSLYHARTVPSAREFVRAHVRALLAAAVPGRHARDVSV